MSLLAAFQFLTILPIKRNFTTEQIAHSTIFFPVVGLAIGLVLALINWLLDFLIPDSVINIILVALLAYCSGGLHLDGLADSMDGAAGHRSVERRLEIMRDSRIGGFGAIGLDIDVAHGICFFKRYSRQFEMGGVNCGPYHFPLGYGLRNICLPICPPGWIGQGFQGRSYSQTFWNCLSGYGRVDCGSLGSSGCRYFGRGVYYRDSGGAIPEKSSERVNWRQLRGYQ